MIIPTIQDLVYDLVYEVETVFDICRDNCTLPVSD